MLAVTLTTTGVILMPRRPGREAAKALDTIRRDLERLVASPRVTPSRRWRFGAARQILRLTLHVSRAGEANIQRPEGLLDMLNLGHAILALKRLAASPRTGRADRQIIQGALSALGAFRTELPDADALARQADMLSDPRATRAMKDAAAALRQAGPLLADHPGSP